jgi:transcriptional regulator with XRE-family HTH domain
MDLKEIGHRIRATRRSLKLSQATLARQLGMSQGAISGIELGTIAEIGVRKLMRLCDALGLELHIQSQQKRPSFDELQRELRDEKASR